MIKSTSSLLIIICAIFLGLAMNCNSTKNTVNAHNLVVTLQKKLSSEYLSTKYAEYNPTKVVKSNKSINQYSAIFNCSESQYSELMTKLEKDELVIKIDNIGDKNIKQSSKSNQHAKTEPIRKNK